MPHSRPTSATFARHFRSADPVIHSLMQRVGPFTLQPHRHRFQMLVRSIISQQLSTKAAKTIRLRLEALVGGTPLTAAALAPLKLTQLRSVGLSLNKASYVLDLAHKVQCGEVNLSRLGRHADEAIIEELTQVRGIGRWTAQMFLIFSLGRLNVFPHDDLGVRSALAKLYGLPDLPNKETSHNIAAAWHPYATVGSWYCWRSLELPAPL